MSYVESENTKFNTEYQHFNTNITQLIYDDYLVKMNSVGFEAAKFQQDIKNNPFPFLPSLCSFNSFLYLDNQKTQDLCRWNTLKSILRNKKVPYNVMDGEIKNYYYKELKSRVTSP